MSYRNISYLLFLGIIIGICFHIFYLRITERSPYFVNAKYYKIDSVQRQMGFDSVSVIKDSIVRLYSYNGLDTIDKIDSKKYCTFNLINDYKLLVTLKPNSNKTAGSITIGPSLNWCGSKIFDGCYFKYLTINDSIRISINKIKSKK